MLGSVAEPLKQASLDRICKRLGLPPMVVSTGSSVPSDMFIGAALQFGLNAHGAMPQLGKRIAEAAGLTWTEACDSTHSPSGGGSTVTR